MFPSVLEGGDKGELAKEHVKYVHCVRPSLFRNSVTRKSEARLLPIHKTRDRRKGVLRIGCPFKSHMRANNST